MRISAIITLAVILLWFGMVEFGAYYLSEQIAGAMDRSANRIVAARGY